MLPCQKCLENNWNYQVSEGWVKATCNICGNEVEFPTHKNKIKHYEPKIRTPKVKRKTYTFYNH